MSFRLPLSHRQDAKDEERAEARFESITVPPAPCDEIDTPEPFGGFPSLRLRQEFERAMAKAEPQDRPDRSTPAREIDLDGLTSKPGRLEDSI